MKIRKIHLVIIQPLGYAHSLGFIDQARFFRYQFRRLGYEVTIGKNRPRFDAVNFIFGVHLLFDSGLLDRYKCVIVNLEQLGLGGAQVSEPYLNMLRSFPVVDYDYENTVVYSDEERGSVPIISFAHAPYLDRGENALVSRPVDILFFGSMNDRRKEMIEKVESSGFKVSFLDFGVYGPERDIHIGSAKAVFNCHFYDLARFEQARVFQCLSLGTPVISECSGLSKPPAQFKESVFWVSSEDIARFFREYFNTPEFFSSAEEKLEGFKKVDVLDEFSNALTCLEGVFSQKNGEGFWVPTELHIGSGKDYMLGWLNVDILETAQPDLLLDLSKNVEFPVRAVSPIVGSVELGGGQLDVIYANNVLEHVPDLSRLMENCLFLLKDGGKMVIEVPYEHAPTAWQDPTHVRALNENSWIYYTDWFWYLGWFENRFLLEHFAFLDAQLKECSHDLAHFMQVRFVKIKTSVAEKMVARSMRPDFGGVPNDLV